MGNLEEIDRFLEKFNLSRLNQEEIEIMNSPITSTEIDAVIKKIFQKAKAQDQMASQENSIKRLGRLIKKKREESNPENEKRKRRDYNRQCRNTKEHKRLL